MKSLSQYFGEYAGYHRTHGNKVCHYVGIPMIMVTLLGLLARLKFGLIDAGLALWLIASVWYLLLDWKVGAPFALVALGAYWLGQAMPMEMLIGLQILGWVLQGIGHAVYEKKSPAFVRNLEHIFIGPLWVFVRIVDRKRTEP